MTDKEPYFVYKLVPSTAPVREPLPEQLPVSALDQQSGFIHLSTAFQVPNTLKLFFKDEPLVYVLRIPYDSVAENLKWENPEGTVCGPRPTEGLFPVSPTRNDCQFWCFLAIISGTQCLLTPATASVQWS